MKEIDERLKKLGLSWHWDEDRECLDLIYNFENKYETNDLSEQVNCIHGQIGCISEWGEVTDKGVDFEWCDEDDIKEWHISIWNNCYDYNKEKRVDIEGFKLFESQAASLELAKFKAELVIMDWLNVD